MTAQDQGRQFDVATTPTATPAPEDASVVMDIALAVPKADGVVQQTVPVSWLQPSPDRLQIAGGLQDVGQAPVGQDMHEIVVSE
jgi:hypothetical protein